MCETFTRSRLAEGHVQLAFRDLSVMQRETHLYGPAVQVRWEVVVVAEGWAAHSLGACRCIWPGVFL